MAVEEATPISTDLISMKYEAEFLQDIRDVIDKYRDSNRAKLTYAQVIGVLHIIQHDLTLETDVDGEDAG